MTISNLSFSATLPPFYYTSGYNTNFSNTNSSLSGNVLLASHTDSTTGLATTNVSSSVNSNGVSYSETGASINGNQLTVNYQTDSTSASSLTNANINGRGVSFSPANATTGDNGLTTIYNTNPNGTFNQTIQGAAISTGTSDNGQNLKLENFAVVGNSLTVTYEIGNNPLHTKVLASAVTPAPAPTPTAGASTGAGDRSPSFSSPGVMTIGDLLASAGGFSSNATLGHAPHSGALNETSNAALILAATLSPGINLSPNSTLQVADFANTSAGAFPTSAPADNSNNATNSGTNGNSNNPFSASTSSNSSGFGPFGSAATQTGIYNAIANASASTILGSNFSAVA